MVTLFLPHGLRAYSLGGWRRAFFSIFPKSQFERGILQDRNLPQFRRPMLIVCEMAFYCVFTDLQQQFVFKKAPFAEGLSTDSTDFSGVGFPKKVPDDPPAATPNTHTHGHIGRMEDISLSSLRIASLRTTPVFFSTRLPIACFLPVSLWR